MKRLVVLLVSLMMILSVASGAFAENSVTMPQDATADRKSVV